MTLFLGSLLGLASRVFKIYCCQAKTLNNNQTYKDQGVSLTEKKNE